MQTLSFEHFKSIEYVIKGGDYNYISAHLPVDLPPGDASLFAKIQIDGNSAQWYVDDNEKYHRITEVSEEDRLAALQDLKARRDRIVRHLAGKVPYAEQLFIIPDENQIFCVRRSGKVEALLCQWGFRRRNAASRQDVLGVLLEAVPEPPVTVNAFLRVKYSDGKPAAGLPLRMDWVGTTEFVTGGDGTWNMGAMPEGSKFTIIDQADNRYPFTILSGVDTYEAVIPLYVDCQVRVLNQEGTLKPGYSLQVQGVPVQADADALVRLEKVLLEPVTEVEVRDETGHVERYRLDREGNSFDFVVRDQFFSSLKILCRWDDGSSIAGCRVFVDNDALTADDTGCVFISGLEPGRTLTVSPADNLSDRRSIMLDRGENELLLVREKEKPRMVRIRIRDYDGRPLPHIHLNLQLAKGPVEADTDDEGCILLPDSMFTDKEKVKINFNYERPDKRKPQKA